MERKPVKSSNIKSIGYDAKTRKLEVEFNSGVYSYDNVSPEKHSALMASESVGGYLHTHIKGKHEHKKL